MRRDERAHMFRQCYYHTAGEDWSALSERRLSLTHAPNQVPGLLGTTENELGLRSWLESQGHTLVTTDDKEGENSTFDKELVDAEIIITTP